MRRRQQQSVITIYWILLICNETCSFTPLVRRQSPVTPPVTTRLHPTLADEETRTSKSNAVSKEAIDLVILEHDDEIKDISIQLPLLQLALAGAATTCMTDMLMHPIDCLKTLQQTDAGFGKSFLETAQFLFEKSGVAGFYSGFLVYALADGSGGALKFAVWETWKERVVDSSWTRAVPKWSVLWIGAGIAFVASSVLIVPGELLKNQLQVGEYAETREAVAGIFAASGFAGFFSGYEGVLYRDVPYTMLELGLYEQFKSMVLKLQQPSRGKQSAMEPWQEVAAAAATGGVTAILTTPIDTIKTKLMVDHYDGFLDCFLATVSNHGLSAVFAGVFARICWILPFTAVYLPTYDFLKRRLLLRHAEYLEKDVSSR